VPSGEKFRNGMLTLYLPRMVTWKTAGSKGLERRGRGREAEEPGPGECRAAGARRAREPGSRGASPRATRSLGRMRRQLRSRSVVPGISSRKVLKGKDQVKRGQRGLNRR